MACSRDCFVLIEGYPMNTMGFLDKLRGKKTEPPAERQSTSESSPSNKAPPEKRVKKYTSEGKPIYE